MQITQWLKEHTCDLSGKTAVVTGATGSLGSAVTEALVCCGAQVILAVRNLEKGRALRGTLAALEPNAQICVMELDISSRASIDAFADRLAERGGALDLLVQIAGIYHNPPGRSADGLEIHFATNAAGPLYLGMRLLPQLARAPQGRMVVMGSIAADYPYAAIDFSDFSGEHARSDTIRYGRTKRILSLGALELLARMQPIAPNLAVTLVHPGISATGLFSSERGGYGRAFYRVIVPLMRLVFMYPRKACLSAVYACCNEVPADCRVGPRGLFGAWGYPAVRRLRGCYQSARMRAAVWQGLCASLPAFAREAQRDGAGLR